MISIEQKNSFLNEIIRLRQSLDALNTRNTLQELKCFENQLTLHELEACFFDASSEDCELKLTALLAQRWERIRGSSMCYTQNSLNPVNQLCLKLAISLSSPITTPSEIEALEPNAGPYCLLMPSLENCEDVYGENIHSLQLHEFVLSDKERVFIPLVSCLKEAAISDEGKLRQMVEIDEKYLELSPSEITRIANHSKQATDLYQAILELNRKRLLGDDIGAQLGQLVVALRKGGVNRGSGAELNAGAEANIGIVAFTDYWGKLSDEQKKALYKETKGLEEIIGRLLRPNDANYKETRFCVELLANNLDPIIEVYNKKPSIQTLQTKIEAHERILQSALKKPQYLIKLQNPNPPKHILHHIFNLNAAEQSKIFKHERYESALIYALANEPESLSEFTLDEVSKRQAALIRIEPYNHSGLTPAAERGEINAIKLLLSWGSDIEAHDILRNTALHYAAYRGHVDAVHCLLEHGALLEARGAKNNTALNFAVMHGQSAVVNRLLQEEVDLNARNNEGLNALGIAIALHPELVEPILMRLATLPADKQAQCLLNVPGGKRPHPNVLFYAAYHEPSLFAPLITVALEQPNIIATDQLFTTANNKGFTPLILAAILGITESINKLIDLGVDIESHDLNGSTALHWAATNGHIDAVNCLLEHGALLEARGAGNNTALNFAVIHGQSAMVNRLLQENVDLNARNDKGLNALDIAIAHHPELVEPILMHLLTFPTDIQAECLLNVPGGPYPNVFLYAATVNTKLLKTLFHSFNNTDLDFKMQPIHEHLYQISSHYQEMIKKSSTNLNYITAVSEAETLLETCINETLKVYQSDDNTDVKILEFKKNCTEAINKAKPVLEKYREWGKVIAAFLLAVFTLPVSLPLYAAGFFSIKTKSEQLIDNLQLDLNKIEAAG